LELTESVIMGDPVKTVEILHTLKAMGTAISIDDFGTGYSSLSYLKRFPLDTLKIDRSFVQDITLDQDDAAIVRAVIALAQSLRLKVVAEGVETQEQLDYLQDLNCDAMQGFLISRPLPSDKLIQFLRSQEKSQSSKNTISFNEFRRAKKP
jgi:EAL domain-containing protein (putative c-di-GMP-specific phosphodiesterase class I)